jgi:kynurenine formamidase
MSKDMPGANQHTLIDLSHTVAHGLITYKGLPAPIICDYLSREASRKLYAPGTKFQIGKIEMVSNTGTYIDSPFHRYEDGKDLSQLDLEKLANLPAIKVRANVSTNVSANGKQSIDISCFPNKASISGKAVLVETGWSKHWNTPQYFEGHPYLTEDAAKFLADSGAVLVGIDSHNIDDVEDLRRPVHSILLKQEIAIVEHMTNLAALMQEDFRFFAVPVKVKGFGTFPVRAFAMVRQSDPHL